LQARPHRRGHIADALTGVATKQLPLREVVHAPI
jgi:hypothetical protein